MGLSVRLAHQELAIPIFKLEQALPLADAARVLLLKPQGRQAQQPRDGA